jgi:Peptidase C13 family
VAASLGLGRAGLTLLAVGITALSVANSYQFNQARPWYPSQTEEADDAPRRERLVLSQETFETQQAVFKQAVDGLLPQRKGVRDVYGIVFAPYGSEDVFQRESKLAAQVLVERFDAQGRVLHLLNHAETTKTLPWATPENLRRAIQAVATRMDREQDVLVLYLTSHGARDFKLAASHWPLEVPALTPGELRKALDDAGIRNRVIMISACYSGGWVDPLATESTLVMTAADATHTSYGCGNRSELTFFGRALWDEQLRKTHSFEDAFAAAVPVIRQREIEGKKADGFSNPQIRVGEAIKPVLADLVKRLDQLKSQ